MDRVPTCCTTCHRGQISVSSGQCTQCATSCTVCHGNLPSTLSVCVAQDKTVLHDANLRTMATSRKAYVMPKLPIYCMFLPHHTFHVRAIFVHVLQQNPCKKYKNISHAAWGGPTKTKYVKAQVTIGTNTPPQRYKRWKNKQPCSYPCTCIAQPHQASKGNNI